MKDFCNSRHPYIAFTWCSRNRAVPHKHHAGVDAQGKPHMWPNKKWLPELTRGGSQ